ncbi:hypothetical protein [Streptomyces sp. NRRL S-87]|uniref:hypothetical protein n=1 Tax=Streptomyces sp. NRRL S-87 TaxID=1463920 RepID=UPI0004C0F36F|nr:hypothetical protein [Streptomyces sp. NRRL S-87]
MSARTVPDAREAGRRVEEILDGLAGAGDRPALAAAEELVRVLMEFYGAGLARLVDGLDPARLPGLLDDELVGGLLALHDLHPEDVHTRIGRVLAAAPEPVELAGFDETEGVLRLRQAAAGGGCGCGSAGTDTARRTLEDAVATLVPEVVSVELEPAGSTGPRQPLLQIGTRPPAPARAR